MLSVCSRPEFCLEEADQGPAVGSQVTPILGQPRWYQTLVLFIYFQRQHCRAFKVNQLGPAFKVHHRGPAFKVMW